MAMEFLVRGAVEHGEPGVFVTFEETEQELKDNVASLGFDLDELIRQKKLAVEFIVVERHEIEETGDYDLEASSSASTKPFARSARSASCSTRSRRSSRACRTRRFCARNCGGCSDG